MMRPYFSENHPQPSDENVVINAIALSMLTILALGIAVYQFLLYQREQEQKRLDTRVYRGYVLHTDKKLEKSPDPGIDSTIERKLGKKQVDREMTRKLLDHPFVTPGGGFNAPGVRSTGVAIVDAIDRVQDRRKNLSQKPAS